MRREKSQFGERHFSEKFFGRIAIDNNWNIVDISQEFSKIIKTLGIEEEELLDEIKKSVESKNFKEFLNIKNKIILQIKQSSDDKLNIFEIISISNLDLQLSLEALKKAPFLVFFLNKNGDVLFLNRKAENFFNSEEDEIKGKNIFNEYPQVRILYDDFLLILSGDKEYIEKEYRFPDKSGELKDLKFKIAPIRKKEIVAFFGEDITFKKLLKEKEAREEKMEAIGTFSTELSKELKNIFSTIHKKIKVLNKNFQLNKLDDNLSSIEKALNDGFKIIEKLSFLGIQDTAQNTTVDINSLIIKIADEFKNKISDSLKINLSLLKYSVYIKGNQNQIKTAFKKLIENAIEAIEEEGEVNINSFLEEKISFGRLRTYITIVIEDSGSGIPDEIKNKIFEPFFSTKNERLKGFGLPIAYGILKNLGAEIWVESELGKGSRFYVKIPAIQIFSDKKSKTYKQSSRKILIVDDEEDIIEVLYTFLKEYGYEVLKAFNGEEAFEIYKKELPDLVITDFSMPFMNGKELIEKIKEINPDAKIILTSALVGNKNIEATLEKFEIDFIKKPFYLKTLKEKLNSHLK